MTAQEREQAILEHMPMVRIMAQRISRKLPQNISLDDLISDGTLGLIAAVDRFDPTRASLRTFVEHKIRGRILDGISKWMWGARADRRWWMPSLDDRMGDISGRSDDKVKIGMTLGDRGSAATAMFHRIALSELPERERQIVDDLDYGLTAREIAAHMGVHETRVSQLKSQAIKRLKG